MRLREAGLELTILSGVDFGGRAVGTRLLWPRRMARRRDDALTIITCVIELESTLHALDRVHATND